MPASLRSDLFTSRRNRPFTSSESAPGSKMRLGRPSAHIQPYFGQDGLCDHHMDSINACQIHARDAIQLTTQIEARGVATRPPAPFGILRLIFRLRFVLQGEPMQLDDFIAFAHTLLILVVEVPLLPQNE